MAKRFFILLFLCLSWPLWGENPLSAAFDPSYITVEDPTLPIPAQLPMGMIDLQTYRAPLELIEAYAKAVGIEQWDRKDNALAPDCTRAEIQALKDYTSESFLDINPALRNLHDGKVSGKPLDAALQTKILMLASGINCAPQYEGTVVRMEGEPPNVLAQYVPDHFVVFRAFTSASKGEAPARSVLGIGDRHEKVIIENARGADIDALKLSLWPEEKEVLIRPGTIFEIISRHKGDPNPEIHDTFVFRQYSH